MESERAPSTVCGKARRRQRSFRVYSKVSKKLDSTSSVDRQRRKKARKGGPLSLRRSVKLIIGVVVTLALLICGVTYLLLIEWPSMKPPIGPQGVETELLRSGEPTRTDEPWVGGYTYEVRFYDVRDNETANVAASIRYGTPSQPQYQLRVVIAHPIETWEIRLDGDPSTTHLESLSLTFNFSRSILVVPLWLSAPSHLTGSNISSSFSLESRMVDTKGHVFLLNFTQLRNLEEPPSSPQRWSWISFQFLMTPESAEPHLGAFTLGISFTLHRMLGGGKAMYQKGTTTLDFQPPPGAASLSSSVISQVAAQLWSRNPLSIFHSTCLVSNGPGVVPYTVDHAKHSTSSSN